MSKSVNFNTFIKKNRFGLNKCKHLLQHNNQ